MEAVIKVLVESLTKHIGASLKWLWHFAWRFFFCPLKKLVFPIRDLRTGIKQSRMRYYRVQFSFQSGAKRVAFQEIDSNGQLRGYFNRHGKRFIPEERHEALVIDNGTFQFPKWRRTDWSDVFSGDTKLGCWGISER